MLACRTWPAGRMLPPPDLEIGMTRQGQINIKADALTRAHEVNGAMTDKIKETGACEAQYDVT